MRGLYIDLYLLIVIPSLSLSSPSFEYKSLFLARRSLYLLFISLLKRSTFLVVPSIIGLKKFIGT